MFLKLCDQIVILTYDGIYIDSTNIIFMTEHYRKKIFTLLAMLLVFLLVNFIFALLTGVNFIDIGLPNRIENTIISVFSFALICLTVWEMSNL